VANGLNLRISGDPVATATEELCDAISRGLAEGEFVRLAIPGGSALAALPGARERLGDAWTRVALTWVDERCVPVDDPNSNRGAVQRLGLLEDPAPASVLPLHEDGESPAQAVDRVTAGLQSTFDNALDVLLLGMGEDGHIASLFPSRERPLHGPVAHLADSPKPPSDRITLTRSILATARDAILLVTGEGKRSALENLLAGDPRLPAHGLSGLVVVTDLEITEWKDEANA
jgi:6-phosphogluconolactonase